MKPITLKWTSATRRYLIQFHYFGDACVISLPNNQGPVGRWDFDNPEDYADYMSTKEALPKAAFQYGVKMAEGRKTGKKVG